MLLQYKQIFALKYIFIMAVMFLQACKNTDILSPEEHNKDNKINFKINIASSSDEGGTLFDAPLVKAASLDKLALSPPNNKSDLHAAFTALDSIGIFAVPAGQLLQASGNIIHNIKIVYDGTNWQGDISWPSGVNNLDFYAYYPYSAQMTNPTNYQFSIKTDQTSIDNFVGSDLMAARAMNTTNSNYVNLTFRHQLSLLQIEIPLHSTAYPDMNVDESLQIMLNRLNTTGMFNLATQQFTSNSSIYSAIRPYRVEKPTSTDYKTSFTYRAIVPTQTLVANQPLILMSQGNKTQIVNQPQQLALIQGKAYSITFTDFPNDIPTTFIKAGTFIMGNPNNPFQSNELPLHNVTLTNDFYMSKYEITIGQYVEFLNANNVVLTDNVVTLNRINLLYIGSSPSPQYNAGTNTWTISANNKDLPITNVTPEGALAFCNWIGGKLPTEAQWEYAARAGTNTLHFFANDIVTNYAWITSNSNNITHKVGLLRANGNSLYDIYGNVAEITRDTYPTSTIPAYNSSDPVTNPIVNSGVFHIVRGGSYQTAAPNSFGRSAMARNSYLPTAGFRIVFEK